MAKESKNNLLKIILFGVILLALIIAASAMMNPTKWFDEKLIQNRNSRAIQMMEQKENTIDIMNIGDSLSTAGFTPMELWRQQGYTSFNIGADGLRMAEAYYSVIEACEKQNPKYLMIESLYMFRYSIGQDMQMVLSQPLYHLFSFLRYHSIWRFEIEGPGVMIYHRGYTVNENVGEYEGDPGYLDLDLEAGNRMTIPAFNSYYFDRIKEYCDKRGIKIVIYSMPSASNYNWERISEVEAFAKEKGVDYVDLNQIADRIGIDWEMDTNDGGDHMNLTGAIKVTTFFGEYFREKGDLTDHRGDSRYSDWDSELVEYDRLVEEMEGKSFQDIWQEQKDKEWDEKYKKKDPGQNNDESK